MCKMLTKSMDVIEEDDDQENDDHGGSDDIGQEFGEVRDDSSAQYHLTFEGPITDRTMHRGPDTKSPSTTQGFTNDDFVPLMPVEEVSILANIEYMVNWGLTPATTDRQGFALAMLQSCLHYLETSTARHGSSESASSSTRSTQSKLRTSPSSRKHRTRRRKSADTSQPRGANKASPGSNVADGASPAPSTPTTILEGELHKRGRVSGLWQPRTFQLTSETLSYVWWRSRSIVREPTIYSALCMLVGTVTLEHSHSEVFAAIAVGS